MDRRPPGRRRRRRDPPSDGFHDPGLAFGREEEDDDDDGDGSRERDEDEGTTMTATTTVAVGGATPKEMKPEIRRWRRRRRWHRGTSCRLSPGPSAADIAREGRDEARKLSSRGDVNDNDNGANDDGWF